jgi:hypothetical protein
MMMRSLARGWFWRRSLPEDGLWPKPRCHFDLLAQEERLSLLLIITGTPRRQ